MSESSKPDSVLRHRLYEDVLALLTGSLLVALGMALYAESMLLVGGTAGLGLLVQYVAGAPFRLAFSAINVPFYALAVWRLGWGFAVRTFIAVSLVSLFSALMPRWIGFAYLDPLFAAVSAGMLSGMGLLVLFRHRAALGGINILAVFLQDRFGLRAGYFQLAVDLAILAGGLLVLSAEGIALSVLSAVVLNLVLAFNHRPGRYMATS